MIRNGQPGDRVERIEHIKETHGRDGCFTASWDTSLGMKGTVIKRHERGKAHVLIVVPDLPNFGEFILWPKELNRLKEDKS